MRFLQSLLHGFLVNSGQAQQGKAVVRMTVCTRCIKSGRVKKPVRVKAG